MIMTRGFSTNSLFMIRWVDSKTTKRISVHTMKMFERAPNSYIRWYPKFITRLGGILDRWRNRNEEKYPRTSQTR